MSTHDLSSEPLAVSGHAARSSTRFSRSGGGGDDLSGNSRISNARTPSGRTSGANSMDLLSADDAGKRVSGGKARARELAVIHPKFTQEVGHFMGIVPFVGVSSYFHSSFSPIFSSCGAITSHDLT